MNIKKNFETEASPVFKVSEINRLIKNQLENKFSELWIEAEVSNLVKHSSGHWYFSLKDESSQIKAVMFRGSNQNVLFKPENGMSLRIFGKVTVYEPRGDYQILCYKMEPLGVGALQQAFEQLKKKLKEEGLFESQHKKMLPEFPKRIAVISSETGAAIQDILNVLKRRSQNQELILIPALVQGDEAVSSLRQALKQSLAIPDLDVLILTRGGGSLEDLWPFNNEALARDIFKYPVPIISAVGHEIDFSISDFVADLRAPTPSAAAEIVTKSKKELLEQVRALDKNLKAHFLQCLSSVKEHLLSLKKQIFRLSPERVLLDLMQKIDDSSKTLFHIFLSVFNSKKEKLKHGSSLLHSFSPLAVLKRGYSITFLNKQAVLDANTLSKKDKITVRLFKGDLEAEVLKTNKKGAEHGF